MDKPVKVSFCTTCKGRLEHLRHTLPLNLANNPDSADVKVEFVVLDYGSDDGLEEWIKDNFQDEIKSGRIRYAKVEPPPQHFKMAHAKNMAHRVATGDILCNVDADNITGNGYAQWLAEQFSKNQNIYTHLSILAHDRRRATLLVKNAANRIKMLAHSVRGVPLGMAPEAFEESVDGMWARIATTKDKFMQLHGYDEIRHQAWGGDDDNFMARAQQAGMEKVGIPYEVIGTVLHHSDEERIKHMTPADQQRSRDALAVHRRPFVQRAVGRTGRIMGFDNKEPIPPANPDGNFGCGTVTINFGDTESLGPVRDPESPSPRPNPRHSSPRHAAGGRGR